MINILLILRKATSVIILIFLSYGLFGYNSLDSIKLPCNTPKIIKQSGDTSWDCLTKSISLFVDASGSGIMSYQWKMADAYDITDATNSNYKIDFPKEGFYYCIVTDSCGSIASKAIYVSIQDYNIPGIIENLVSDSTCAGMEHSFRFLTASSEPTLYHWYKDDIMIDGASDSQLIINNTSISDSGNYHCIAEIGICKFTVRSNNANLKINNLPVITLAKDTTITLSQSLNLDAGRGHRYYHWSNGDENEMIKIDGKDLGKGKHSLTLTVTNNSGCSCFNTININVNPMLYSINAVVKYFKTDKCLRDMNIVLCDSSNNILDSTVTDNLGRFRFDNLESGKYIFKTFARSGGVDPQDAFILSKYFTLQYNITDSILLNAADVNDDKRIDPTDALLISKRFVKLIDSFKKPDWILINNCFIIKDSDIENSVIKAICTGDANASFNRF